MKCCARALRHALAALVALLAVLPARAMLPESGWYWNPNESGRGFNLEIQDNALFLSAFVYRPDGSAAWYVGGGPMGTDRTWSADLYETVGGQCVGCAYRAPILMSAGRVSIAFTSERTATLSLLGGTVGVVRNDWSNSGAESRDALFGEWSTTEGDPGFPIYFGERISLYLPRDGSNGPYAAGSRTGSQTSTAVGSYSVSQRAYSILLDSSTSYYAFYVFTLNTLNRIEGAAWVFRKTASPTGNGMYFVAHRTKSYTRVRGLNGPGVGKGTAEVPEQEAIDAARALRSMAKAGAPVAIEGVTLEFAQEMARELAVQLEAARR